MLKRALTDIKTVREAIDSKKLVVFAGAGISIDAGVPSWGDLMKDLQASIEIPANEADFLKIAQMYFNERDEKEYIEKIRKILRHQQVSFNEIHEAIFDLKPEHILTTNYDDLCDQVIRAKVLPFSIVTKDVDFPYANNSNLLVKIHGDLTNTDIVLKEDDYLDYSAKHPLIEAFIKSVFTSKVVLFVGYSFSDINLKYLLQTVRGILGKNFQNAYLLSTDVIHPAQRHYLKCKGVVAISYDDFYSDKAGEKKHYIEEYLAGNNAKNYKYHRQVDRLSERGQKLYNFLRFISTYNAFDENNRALHIIEQIYNSLFRFKDLKSLPPEFITNLFPFNTSASYKGENYKRLYLKAQNPEIIQLFFEQATFENNRVSLDKMLDIDPRKKQQYEEKTLEICKKLNNSGIFWIGKPGKKVDSFGNAGWSNDYINIFIENQITCECLKCNYKKLKLKDVLTKVQKSSVTETSELGDDLLRAYINYKLGNFDDSFNQYYAIANKAWRSGKFISYFIAKLNAKRLKGMIRIDFTMNDNKRNDILEKIKVINDDQLLYQLMFLPEEEYQLLKDINNNTVLKDAEEGINKWHEDILKTYKLYKGSGSITLSPSYPKEIWFELYKLVSFYESNLILFDEYNEFRRVCFKAIEGLIISYATHKDFDKKLHQFDSFSVDCMIFYAKPDKLLALINEYSIETLNTEEDTPDHVLELGINFLNSFYHKNTFIGDLFLPENLTQLQLHKYFFESRCQNILDNIVILLSKMDLPKQKGLSFSRSLVQYISIENFLRWVDTKYITHFMYRHGVLLEEQDFKLLLSSIGKYKIYFHSGEFLYSIGDALEQKQSGYKISNEQTYNQMISQLESSGDLHSLWPLLNDKLKSKLKAKIEEKLKEKFSGSLYFSASLKKIIDYKQFFQEYINELNSHPIDERYQIRNEEWIPNDFTYHNFARFIYQQDIELDEEIFAKLPNLPEYMKFILKPEDYDYTHFKPEWLFMFCNEYFLKKLNNITPLKTKVIDFLRENPESRLSTLYFKYLY